MTSAAPGIDTSPVEVTNVSAHGFWLFVEEREHFVAFAEFPWFRDATNSSRPLASIHTPCREMLVTSTFGEVLSPRSADVMFMPPNDAFRIRESSCAQPVVVREADSWLDPEFRFSIVVSNMYVHSWFFA